MGRWDKYLPQSDTAAPPDDAGTPQASPPTSGRWDKYLPKPEVAALPDDTGAANIWNPKEEKFEEQEFTPQLLPEQKGPATGALSLADQKGYVPKKRARAVFTDIAPSGSTGLTAEDLSGAKEGNEKEKSQLAFIGGALQGATLGHGDELAAIWSDKPYAEALKDNRDAFKTAHDYDPTSNLIGHVAGGTAMMPFLGPLAAKGESLLTVPNTLRAAAMGGIEGLGESEADLAGGDVRGAATDALKGAGYGAVSNAALGAGGAALKGARNWAAKLPEKLANRADDALLDAATTGTGASGKEALQGEVGKDRQQILDLIKSKPGLERSILAGKRAEASEIVRSEASQNAEKQASELARIDSSGLKIDVDPFIAKQEARAAELEATGSVEAKKVAAGIRARANLLKETYAPEEPLAFAADKEVRVAPVLKKLEEQRDALLANPALKSQQSAAAKQKQIDAIREKWMPEAKPPELKGPALLGKLTDGMPASEKQFTNDRAKRFLDVAKEYNLGEIAHDDSKVLAETKRGLDKASEEREKLYGQLGAAAEVPIASISAELSAWRDELAQSMSSAGDAVKVDGFIKDLWAANGRGGTRFHMPAEELRQEITKIQDSAFSGSYLDPNKSRAMGREAASRLRKVFDDHVAKIDSSLPPDSVVGKKLADLNRRYSALIAFHDAAEKRVSTSLLKEAPLAETRTGFASAKDATAMANAIEDQEAKKAVAEVLGQQLGGPVTSPGRGKISASAAHAMISPTEDADVKRALTGEFYNQLGTENAHAVEALRNRGELLDRLRTPVEHMGTRVTAPAAYNGVTASALKYGKGAAKSILAGAEEMVVAAQSGASPKVLRAIARKAKLPTGLAEELIRNVGTREGGRWRRGGPGNTQGDAE